MQQAGAAQSRGMRKDMLPEFNLKDRNVRTCDGASVCQTRAQSSDVQNVTAESSTWGLSQLLATYERRAEAALQA